MVIKNIRPMSAAKMAAALYGLIGLIIGAVVSLVSLATVGVGLVSGENTVLGAMFGVGAIVLLPIFYAVMGFVVTAIAAALYNVVAGWVGGIEIDVQ